MKLTDIKPHLRSYSIVQRRKTTINHAFASALAPCDEYDEDRLKRAMTALGQTNLDDLRCVYCPAADETWDHLVGLVKDSELNGYGHQVGNLVPCCRKCNSLKGNLDWRAFLKSAIPDPVTRERINSVLEAHIRTFAIDVDLSRAKAEHPLEWERYARIKREIIDLMAEADHLAAQLRLQVVVHARPRNGVRCEQRADLFQEFAAQDLTLDRQATTLVVVEPDPFLPQLFVKHLIFGTQVLDHVLLLLVDPASDNGYQQLPGLKHEGHDVPVRCPAHRWRTLLEERGKLTAAQRAL